MKRLFKRYVGAVWSDNLGLMALAVFSLSLGQGLFGSVRSNFFVDTLGLNGGQVLWLEGLRELPGLILVFLAALSMHLPLSRRAAASLMVMGAGFMLYATVHSFTALVGMALVASLGFHNWVPLYGSLGMGLATRDKSGAVMGSLSSVTALASIVGMGLISVVSRALPALSLRAYYLAGGACIVLAGLLISRLPTHIGASATKQPRLLFTRRYWLYYILTFFSGSRKQVLGTFGTLVLVQSYGLEVWQISLLLLASSILNFVAAPFLGRLVDSLGERTTLSGSYTILALCCVGYALAHNVAFLAGLLLAIKLTMMLGIGLSTYVNRIAPAEELTPTLAAGTSVDHISSVGAPLLAGLAYPLVGYEGVFLGTAALLLLSVPFALSLKVPRAAALRPAPATAE